MASVRFICGTQIPAQTARGEGEPLPGHGRHHPVLVAASTPTAACSRPLLGEEDAVISDALNHASIIDGIRLCKAQRLRYANGDLNELENCLKQAASARTRLIATDGVFSMDGFIAKLKGICDLAEKYDALVMVDDSHATGFMGARGRGTHEHCGVMDRVDILTGTFGKALGGGSGGYIAARKPIVEWLRQRSRPYLFSNSIPPVVAARRACACWTCWRRSTELREKLFENARYFRAGLEKAGFELKPGEHPIIPVMLGDAALAGRMANRLLEMGVYVIGVLLPGGAEGPGPHPHADVRSLARQAARSRARSVHDRRPRARHSAKG